LEHIKTDLGFQKSKKGEYFRSQTQTTFWTSFKQSYTI